MSQNKDEKEKKDIKPEMAENIEQTDAEETVEEVAAEEIADEETEEINELDKLNTLLTEQETQIEKQKKEYLFLMAEFDNFRKRTVRERADLIKNAAEAVLKDLLPIVDDFERGLAANKETEGAEALKEGMELIYNKLVKYLSQHGVKPMETTGMAFDTEFHEAVALVPASDEKSKGIILDTVEKGYMYNDKVLRHAKVVVCQ